MGRGACSTVDLLEYGFNTLRSAVTCVFFVACAGPILAIVGITMLISPNNRADNVAKYNSAITAFAPQLSTVTSTQGYVVGYPSFRMNAASSSIVVSGNKDGVNAGTTVKVTSSSSVYASSMASPSAYLYIGTNSSGNVVSGPMPPTFQTASASYTCSYLSCSSVNVLDYCRSRYSCSTDGTRDCSSSSSSSSSSSKKKQDNCRITCYYTSYLTSVCYAMTLSPSTTGTPTAGSKWVGSTKYGGCYYSSGSTFTAGAYTACASSSAVTLSFMSDADPSFTLATVTGGTSDFGLTAAQQAALGAALLIIGILFIGFAVALCLVARRMLQDENNRNHMHAAFGRPPPGYVPYDGNQSAQPMMAVPQPYPPMWGGQHAPPHQQQQPMSAAPQQHPGYGQAPPPPQGAYQPQPAACGQPAAYGQGAPGYGQGQPYQAPHPGYGQHGFAAQQAYQQPAATYYDPNAKADFMAL